MKMGRLLLVLVMVLFVACPILAAEKEAAKKAEKKAPKCPAAQRIEQWTEGLSLTDEQKAQLDPVKKEFGPKLTELTKKREAIFTPEQKQTMEDARKAAAKEGKKGRDLYAAANAAVTLSEEQQAKLAVVRKEMGQIEKDLRAALMGVLTPEQKEQVKKAKKPAK